MAQCGNCQASLGCSCQIKTASDGKSVCANCISAYEAHLQAQRNNAALNKN